VIGSAHNRPAKAAEVPAPAQNPAGVVYGVIAIGALLAAESGRHETYLDTVSSAFIATGLYWLGHAYAGALGRRLQGGETLTAATLRRALAHDWAIVRGAAIPVVALLVAWAAGAAQGTAVTAALWSAVAAVIAFEALAALRSRASLREVAVELAVGVALGSAILALRIILE
jgi:hypothetical protein